jgi:hypothetical protein
LRKMGAIKCVRFGEGVGQNLSADFRGVTWDIAGSVAAIGTSESGLLVDTNQAMLVKIVGRTCRRFLLSTSWESWGNFANTQRWVSPWSWSAALWLLVLVLWFLVSHWRSPKNRRFISRARSVGSLAQWLASERFLDQRKKSTKPRRNQIEALRHASRWSAPIRLIAQKSNCWSGQRRSRAACPPIKF